MSRKLPRSLDNLQGLRAARWLRESTTGQWDNFGPDAQLEQQDRAIKRFGLVDTGLRWSVAASGWKSAWRTPEWQSMLQGAADGQFDVIVVGYASRFLRNLHETLNALKNDLHPAGVAVLFVDEGLLSSDPDHWEQFARNSLEAEAYSHKLSKRVGEGYAAKRRRLGVPGGNRAAYGLIREGKPSALRIDEAKASIVRQAFELASSGATDQQVATATGLKPKHVAEILTNPIYAGRLRTGEIAGVDAIIDPAQWSAVQTGRERRRTRAPGRIIKRSYPLKLSCISCGRFLYGDTGRYRHPPPTCDGFISGTPIVRRRYKNGHDRRVQGHSYPQAAYENAVGSLLGEIGKVDDAVIAQVVSRYESQGPQMDLVTLARIGREREAAASRLTLSRDVDAWRATTTRLDAEERIAREPKASQRLEPEDVLSYLRSLPSMWADTGPEGRQALVGSFFGRIAVKGYERMEYELTDHAVRLGMNAALPAVLELRGSFAEFGRGERI